LGDPEVKETAGHLRPRKLTKLGANHRVSGESAAFHPVGEKRQVFSKTVGEIDHFGDDFNGNLGAYVGNIRGDIIDIRTRHNAGVDIGHTCGIHVNHDGQEIRRAGAPRRQPGSGAPFFPKSPGQENCAGLPVGREHRPKEGRGNMNPFADRFQELQDEVIVALGPIKREPTGRVVTSDGSRHADRKIVGKGVSRARAARWGDTGRFEKGLEGRAPRLSPQPVEHAEQDDGAVVVNCAGTPFGEHRHKGVGDGLRPLSRSFNGLEDKGQQVKGLDGETLEVRVGPTVPPRGLRGRGGFDDTPKCRAGHAPNLGERGEAIEGGKPPLSLELPRLWGPKLPPPVVNLSELGGFAGLSAAGPDGRKANGGRTLPDVAIHPGSLDGVVTPGMPTITPVLAVFGDGGGDLGFCVF
jgi:hypothetical protein